MGPWAAILAAVMGLLGASGAQAQRWPLAFAWALGDHGRPTRVAILNFGPPTEWNEAVEDTVGVQITARAFQGAVPLLQADNVEVVVVRVNSSHGAVVEAERFVDVWETQFKSRFRTAAWVDTAQWVGAVAVYPLAEVYFTPDGTMGDACPPFELEVPPIADFDAWLALGARISILGGHDPKIMRSMQIQDPLSATIDPNTGEVKWYQGLSGEAVVNPRMHVLTLTAADAVKFKFARGIASTKEELVKAMGLQEVEWAGQAAADLVDNSMKEADRTNKKLIEVYIQYEIALAAARSQSGEERRALREASLTRAREHLAEIRQMKAADPIFAVVYPLGRYWFEEQERVLRVLLK